MSPRDFQATVLGTGHEIDLCYGAACFGLCFWSSSARVKLVQRAATSGPALQAALPRCRHSLPLALAPQRWSLGVQFRIARPAKSSTMAALMMRQVVCVLRASTRVLLRTTRPDLFARAYSGISS